MYDTIIIGSGVAGFSAGLYAGRYNLKTAVMMGHEPFGYTATGGIIENYPGFTAIDGFELMNNMKKQVETLGVELIQKEVIDIKKGDDSFIIVTSEKEFTARSLILCMGTERRKLGLPKEDTLFGKGIHYCTTCDAPMYKGKIIAVVGGGDSAVKGAVEALQHVKKLFLIVRKDRLRADPINEERLIKFSNKEIFFQTEVSEIMGSDKLQGVKLTKSFHDSFELQLDGLFIEVGSMPRNDLAKKIGVALDEKGYIITDPTAKTNVPGVFASGDITNGKLKQIVTAAAEGAKAATSAFDFVSGKKSIH